MKESILKKSRSSNGKLTSYVTGMEYDDEGVLEFSHKTAIGLGKYIFSDSVHTEENIVLVEKVLNRTMGQMSIETFKTEYKNNIKQYKELLKAA